MSKSTFPRILITGLGCVAPLGNDVPTFWNALINGQSGIDELTKIDVAGLPNSRGGEVRDIYWGDYGEDGECSEATQFAVVATHEAIADAQLNMADLAHAGIALSTHFASTAAWQAYCATVPEAKRALFEKFQLENAADYIVDEWQMAGPKLTINDGSVASISAACEWLQRGHASIALCGGYESLGISALAGFPLLRTATPEKCRPFDAQRSGTLFGEGAGMIVLETWESAHRRNAKVYGEILGWTHHKDDHGFAAAMQQALTNAALKPDDIDYINAHGSGNAEEDLAETQAIKSTFGERAKELPVSAIKAATSHTLGATDVIAVIATTQALIHQRIPPTLNYQTPDPECDLDYVPNQARSHEMRIALANARGINGNSASLVIGVVEQQGF